MSDIAVGAYLRRMREARGMSREEVSRRIATNENTVIAMEMGYGDIRASMYAAFCDEVDADPVHVAALLENPQASEDEAITMANEHLSSPRSRQQMQSNGMSLKSVFVYVVLIIFLLALFFSVTQG